eukprot:CAMPEP_0194176076 /NCGR_PEP_ID=MMETSP0154-20130528/10063_1 /TAXON_ID=1049557 /ORGANISM="Thalassiothrix antarctica, Strain L6-D1" /LENGTH=1487 /DNA_ID=CAMNT_0038890141 /DNA_START=352 /DNA_END=4815 /DNA_ORIENTATION=+
MSASMMMTNTTNTAISGGSIVVGGDPSALLNSRLANALSTGGDAQYWEDTISPSEIRQTLSSVDPSNPTSTVRLLRGMKWLLASISKGRDVSDFYAHVVKLVQFPHSLEVRKMVYMYLVQYADHDSETRELSLLSINSFQRGLADHEPLIRALALRVLTSIRIADVLQIQILGVQKCAIDQSPYVRKCAANALAKLHAQISDSGDALNLQQEKVLLETMQNLLYTDNSTMVMTSAVITFSELCPDRLDLLHGCYRKICHMLIDMDEWGQVVVIDTLTRYLRRYFAKPRGMGSAEAIDAERRVGRSNKLTTTNTTNTNITMDSSLAIFGGMNNDTADAKVVTTTAALPPRKKIMPQKFKRRVAKQGFYSDEEDGSTDEELYPSADGPVSLSSAMREKSATAVPMMSLSTTGGSAGNQFSESTNFGGINTNIKKDNYLEDKHLDPDHRLLLHASLSLLKSRNSAVVMAVCSMQYYCGVASIPVRTALGKALVRIHRDRREIQYAVLTSIRCLISECPSAFSPFLSDFFVKATDPNFTKLTKLDIMTSLALDPTSIEAVLKELRTYIRQYDDNGWGASTASNSTFSFACAAIRAVGKVSELARIVHDRHAANKSGNIQRERQQANSVALSALFGLVTITKASRSKDIVSEAVVTIQHVLQLLWSDYDSSSMKAVEDTNNTQKLAVQSLLLLLINSLSRRRPIGGDAAAVDENDEENDDTDGENNNSNKTKINLNPTATAAAIWIIGEMLTCPNHHSILAAAIGSNASKTRLELARLLARSFAYSLECIEKMQAIHFATKLIASSSSSNNKKETALCEFLLAMGRTDTDPNIRDRARFESHLLHSSSIGLQYDTDRISTNSISSDTNGRLSIDQMKIILLGHKPPSSALPVKDEEEQTQQQQSLDIMNTSTNTNTKNTNTFRLGTLSSVMRHSVKGDLPLPPWASANSPSSLREQTVVDTTPRTNNNKGSSSSMNNNKGFSDQNNPTNNNTSGFYGGESSSSSSSSSDSDSDSGSSDSDGDSDSSISSDDDSSSSSSDDSPDDDDDSDDDDSSSSSSSEDDNVMNAMTSIMPLSLPTSSSKRTIMNQPPASNDQLLFLDPTPTMTTTETSSNMQVLTVSDDSDSDDSDSDDSSEDDDNGITIPMADTNLLGMGSTTTTKSNLLDMSSTSSPALELMGGKQQSQMASPKAVQTTQPSRPNTATASYADGLAGLVMAPVITDTAVGEKKVADPDIDRDSSFWMKLTRPELAGGLSVKARYLRGPTRDREARLIGLDPGSPVVVLLQLRIENKDTNAGSVLRRIRFIVRNSPAAGRIGLQQSVVPPEITTLKKGKMTICILGLVFASLSNREGTLQAKFDLKSGRGSTPLDIRPSLVELVKPLTMDVPMFEQNIHRLRGFQRITSDFTIPSAATNTDYIPRMILKQVALRPLDEQSWTNNKTLQLVGCLPASATEKLYIVVQQQGTSSGKITVCCDNAMATNSILDSLKKALRG